MCWCHHTSPQFLQLVYWSLDCCPSSRASFCTTPHILSCCHSRQNRLPTWRHCCDWWKAIGPRLELMLVECGLKLDCCSWWPLVQHFQGWRSWWALWMQGRRRRHPVGLSCPYRLCVKYRGNLYAIIAVIGIGFSLSLTKVCNTEDTVLILVQRILEFFYRYYRALAVVPHCALSAQKSWATKFLTWMHNWEGKCWGASQDWSSVLHTFV